MKWIPSTTDLAAVTALVREAMNAAPGAPLPPAPPAAVQPDVMGQLKQLGELRDAGVLTPDEFDRKKAELLDRL